VSSKTVFDSLVCSFQSHSLSDRQSVVRPFSTVCFAVPVSYSLSDRQLAVRPFFDSLYSSFEFQSVRPTVSSSTVLAVCFAVSSHTVCPTGSQQLQDRLRQCVRLAVSSSVPFKTVCSAVSSKTVCFAVPVNSLSDRQLAVPRPFSTVCFAVSSHTVCPTDSQFSVIQSVRLAVSSFSAVFDSLFCSSSHTVCPTGSQ